MNLIIKAAQFAETAHKGQVRKYTNAPYITHPARVATRYMLLPTATEEGVCAAWLHDVVEDCGVNPNEIERFISVWAMQLVVELTNVSKVNMPTSNRATRKRADCERLAKASATAHTIKCIDRIDNLREMGEAPAKFRDLYLRESTDLLAALTKAPVLVYSQWQFFAAR